MFVSVYQRLIRFIGRRALTRLLFYPDKINVIFLLFFCLFNRNSYLCPRNQYPMLKAFIMELSGKGGRAMGDGALRGPAQSPRAALVPVGLTASGEGSFCFSSPSFSHIHFNVLSEKGYNLLMSYLLLFGFREKVVSLDFMSFSVFFIPTGAITFSNIHNKTLRGYFRQIQ